MVVDIVFSLVKILLTIMNIASHVMENIANFRGSKSIGNTGSRVGKLLSGLESTIDNTHVVIDKVLSTIEGMLNWLNHSAHAMSHIAEDVQVLHLSGVDTVLNLVESIVNLGHVVVNVVFTLVKVVLTILNVTSTIMESTTNFWSSKSIGYISSRVGELLSGLESTIDYWHVVSDIVLSFIKTMVNFTYHFFSTMLHVSEPIEVLKIHLLIPIN